jgi:hypothetical protein
LIWQGVQVAQFALADKHYDRLAKVNESQTRLLHGEYFIGLFSYFISQKMLQKMENAFMKCNQILKQRIENER